MYYDNRKLGYLSMVSIKSIDLDEINKYNEIRKAFEYIRKIGDYLLKLIMHA